MAETQILASEPGYKVKGFRDEFLERRRQAIVDMRPELRGLVLGLLKTIESVVHQRPNVELHKIRVEETMLTKDGNMALTLSFLGLSKGVRSEDVFYVDDLVDEFFKGDARWSLVSYEVGQFISALVNQFCFIVKRDPSFDLTRVAFSAPRWVDGKTVFSVTYKGEPLGIKNAGW